MVNRGKRCVVIDAKSVLMAHNINVSIDATCSVVTLNGVEYAEATLLARRVVELMRAYNNSCRYEKWQALELV